MVSHASPMSPMSPEESGHGEYQAPTWHAPDTCGVSVSASVSARSTTPTTPTSPISTTNTIATATYYEYDHHQYTKPSIDCSDQPTRHPHIRSQTFDVATNRVVSPPIRRKPLSSAASSLAGRSSNGSAVVPSYIDLPKPEQRFSRSGSVDSPTIYEFPVPPQQHSGLRETGPVYHQFEFE